MSGEKFFRKVVRPGVDFFLALRCNMSEDLIRTIWRGDPLADHFISKWRRSDSDVLEWFLGLDADNMRRVSDWYIAYSKEN